MIAIKIDPFGKRITEVDIDGDLESYYRELETPLSSVECFTCPRINKHGDVVYVDDNGLSVAGQAFFMVKGYHSPLAGNGLILGTDMGGGATSPTVGLDWAAKNVVFMPSALAHLTYDLG